LKSARTDARFVILAIMDDRKSTGRIEREVLLDLSSLPLQKTHVNPAHAALALPFKGRVGWGWCRFRSLFLLAIPAEAGIQLSLDVIPAQAGIHSDS
jgi:hypothetical protein